MKGYLELQKLLVLVFEYGFDHMEYPGIFAIRSQFHSLPNIVTVTWETVKNTFADISQPYYKKTRGWFHEPNCEDSRVGNSVPCSCLMLILVTGICFFSSSWHPFSPQFDNMEKERALEACGPGVWNHFLPVGPWASLFNHGVAVFSLKGHGTTYLQKILENKALSQSHACRGSLVEVSHVLGEVVF